MALLKKNWAVLVTVLLAALLVMLVIWIYDKRIHRLEKPIPHIQFYKACYHADLIHNKHIYEL